MEGFRFQPIGRAFDLAIPEAEALGHNFADRRNKSRLDNRTLESTVHG
jgi:hypothetical protein